MTNETRDFSCCICGADENLPYLPLGFFWLSQAKLSREGLVKTKFTGCFCSIRCLADAIADRQDELRREAA